MVEFIIKGKASFGKTRSEQEQNMRKEWGSTMSDTQLDKLKYIERKQKEAVGKAPHFIKQTDVEKVE